MGELNRVEAASVYVSAVAANLAVRGSLDVAHLDHDSGELDLPGATHEGVEDELAARGGVAEEGLRGKTTSLRASWRS
jgi:hypothetical protein